MKSARVQTRAFATVELPLVVFGFLAIVGLLLGAFLWIHNGYLTIGAWIGFSLVVPLVAFIALIFFLEQCHKRRQRHKDSSNRLQVK